MKIFPLKKYTKILTWNINVSKHTPLPFFFKMSAAQRLNAIFNEKRPLYSAAGLLGECAQTIWFEGGWFVFRYLFNSNLSLLCVQWRQSFVYAQNKWFPHETICCFRNNEVNPILSCYLKQLLRTFISIINRL